MGRSSPGLGRDWGAQLLLPRAQTAPSTNRGTLEPALQWKPEICPRIGFDRPQKVKPAHLELFLVFGFTGIFPVKPSLSCV